MSKSSKAHLIQNTLFVNLNQKKDAESQQNKQFSERGIYVREDDQDWGSAGMNDVQIDQE